MFISVGKHAKIYSQGLDQAKENTRCEFHAPNVRWVSQTTQTFVNLNQDQIHKVDAHVVSFQSQKYLQSEKTIWRYKFYTRISFYLRLTWDQQVFLLFAH